LVNPAPRAIVIKIHLNLPIPLEIRLPYFHRLVS
jgi:hypothetical protein